MGCTDQDVIEVVARYAVVDLQVEQLLQRRRLDLRRRSGEDDALALLDRHLEVAGHVEVLVRGVAALLLLRVLNAAIPVGHEDEFVLLRELHVEVGIAGIHTGLDAAVDQRILTAGGGVLVGELPHGTEGQEGAETQRGGRMGIHQRVADEQTVLVMLENHFLLQDDTTHAIGRRGNFAGVKLTDVLVPVGAECVALILVEA